MANSKLWPQLDCIHLTTAVIGTSALLFGVIYWRIKRRYEFWYDRNVQCPPPSFLLGNYLETSKESHLFVHKRWIERYGRVFGTFDLLMPKLIVADADLVKQMLVKDFYLLPERRTDFIDHPIEKKFSMFAEGEHWKKTRSVLTPAFSTAKFKNIFNQMDICSERMIHHIHNLVERGQASDLDAIELFKNYTSDVISRSIFSVSFLESYESPDKIIESILAYFDAKKYKMVLSLILPSWFKTLIRFSVNNMSALNYA